MINALFSVLAKNLYEQLSGLGDGSVYVSAANALRYDGTTDETRFAPSDLSLDEFVRGWGDDGSELLRYFISAVEAIHIYLLKALGERSFTRQLYERVLSNKNGATPTVYVFVMRVLKDIYKLGNPHAQMQKITSLKMKLQSAINYVRSRDGAAIAKQVEMLHFNNNMSKVLMVLENLRNNIAAETAEHTLQERMGHLKNAVNQQLEDLNTAYLAITSAIPAVTAINWHSFDAAHSPQTDPTQPLYEPEVEDVLHEMGEHRLAVTTEGVLLYCAGRADIGSSAFDAVKSFLEIAQRPAILEVLTDASLSMPVRETAEESVEQDALQVLKAQFSESERADGALYEKCREGKLYPTFGFKRGQTVYSTEGYNRKGSALYALRKVLKNAGVAPEELHIITLEYLSRIFSFNRTMLRYRTLQRLLKIFSRTAGWFGQIPIAHSRLAALHYNAICELVRYISSDMVRQLADLIPFMQSALRRVPESQRNNSRYATLANNVFYASDMLEMAEDGRLSILQRNSVISMAAAEVEGCLEESVNPVFVRRIMERVNRASDDLVALLDEMSEFKGVHTENLRRISRDAGTCLSSSIWSSIRGFGVEDVHMILGLKDEDAATILFPESDTRPIAVADVPRAASAVGAGAPPAGAGVFPVGAFLGAEGAATPEAEPSTVVSVPAPPDYNLILQKAVGKYYRRNSSWSRSWQNASELLAKAQYSNIPLTFVDLCLLILAQTGTRCRTGVKASLRVHMMSKLTKVGVRSWNNNRAIKEHLATMYTRLLCARINKTSSRSLIRDVRTMVRVVFNHIDSVFGQGDLMPMNGQQLVAFKAAMEFFQESCDNVNWDDAVAVRKMFAAVNVQIRLKCLKTPLDLTAPVGAPVILFSRAQQRAAAASASTLSAAQAFAPPQVSLRESLQAPVAECA